MKPHIWLILLSLMLVQCKPSQYSVAEEEKILLEIKRTVCYGTCPDYIATIYTSGRVFYNGKKFVPVEGSREFVISDEELVAISEKIESIDFFNLEDQYYEQVTDLPTTYVTVYRENGESKKVMDYYGAPTGLKELEDLIQETIFGYLE